MSSAVSCSPGKECPLLLVRQVVLSPDNASEGPSRAVHRATCDPIPPPIVPRPQLVAGRKSNLPNATSPAGECFVGRAKAPSTLLAPNQEARRRFPVVSAATDRCISPRGHA